MLDSSKLPKGTRIRGEIIGYTEIRRLYKEGKQQNPSPGQSTASTSAQNNPVIGSVNQGPRSALSVNQSGGITAGTINNYVPTQRTVTTEQRRVLVATLKEACPFDIAVRGVPGNAESLEYATQIKAVIEEAGCTTKRARFLIDTSPGYGVWIALHDTNTIPHGADVLIDAFAKAGITVRNQTLDAIEPGIVYVMVEFNDSKPPL